MDLLACVRTQQLAGTKWPCVNRRNERAEAFVGSETQQGRPRPGITQGYLGKEGISILFRRNRVNQSLQSRRVPWLDHAQRRSASCRPSHVPRSPGWLQDRIALGSM